MADTYRTSGMGWLPDYPDYRDFTIHQSTVTPKQEAVGQTEPVGVLLAKVGLKEAKARPHPRVDLRKWFSPVEHQGQLGSCTSQAVAGLVEYFEKKAFGKHIDASRLFLYKVTRNMLHWTGDTGAFLRSAMGALVLFGVPPEEYWPYDPENFDLEPPAFCYAFAQDYQAIQYYRLDTPDTSGAELLSLIKAELTKELPAMFGFTCFGSCLSQAARNGGHIPVPTSRDKIVGGHAVIAAGYDDEITIRNADQGGSEATGAFLIRNSWGESWGEGGYGWLPYKYVLNGLATDWWSLLKSEWVDASAFGEAQPA